MMIPFSSSAFLQGTLLSLLLIVLEYKDGCHAFQNRAATAATTRTGGAAKFFSKSPLRYQNEGGKGKPSQEFTTGTESPVQIPSLISNPREVPGPGDIPSRAEQVRQLQRSDVIHDVLIIGGGATGCGVALDASSRGLKVACIERGDFSSETSSRSTKLIWAGIKYMATAVAAVLSTNLFTKPVDTISTFIDEMNLVFHCADERRFMIEKQKHLAYFFPIYVPFYNWVDNPPPLGHPLFTLFPFLAPTAFKMYDAMSGFTCPPSYVLSKEEALEQFPQLEEEKLKYVAVFHEGHHNDARTNLAIAMTAAEHGAKMANYLEMVDLVKDETGRVTGAFVVDRMTGEQFEIHAKKVVLAGGPFTDNLRKKEQKKSSPAVQAAWGTHIVLPGHFVPFRKGLLDYKTSDGRFLFIASWQNHTLVGTTDKKGPVSSLHLPPEKDVEWLVKESRKYLKIKAKRSDVLSGWRGFRPLAVDPHGSPGHVSRDHIISENPDTGVIFVAGGKWTTWREMAEDVTNKIVGDTGPRCATRDITLHGGKGFSEDLTQQLTQVYQMSPDIANHLVGTYGGQVWAVCEIAKSTGTDERLVAGYPYLQAEVVYACREYACTIEDILSRRTRLAFLNKEKALEAIPIVASIMAKELLWSNEAMKSQIDLAEIYIESFSGKEAAKLKGQSHATQTIVLP